MKTTRVPDGRCHSCGRALDAVTHLGNQMPKAGDFTACIGCAALHRFDANLTLQPVSREEWASLSPELRSELWHMRKLILELHCATN